MESVLFSLFGLIYERSEKKRQVPLNLGDSAFVGLFISYVGSTETAELLASGKSTNSYD